MPGAILTPVRSYRGTMRMYRSMVLRVLGMVLLVMIVAGCAAEAESLAGTEWRLSGWSVSSLNPADFEITAEFDGERIGGKAGVNSYGGGYSVGPAGAFSTGDLVTTLMAGPEPAMRAERVYLDLLQQARRYEREDGALTLLDERENVLLIFEPR